ncbi:MAG: hypothetical protein OXH11_06865 [Candidatus Aminicenantes bacterium]|nr:hypothetical protein [Candidatus Aminicenantes bacterium]
MVHFKEVNRRRERRISCRRSRENWSPGEISARTIELLEAAYRSVASGHAERVVPGSCDTPTRV